MSPSSINAVCMNSTNKFGIEVNYCAFLGEGSVGWDGRGARGVGLARPVLLKTTT